MDLNTLRSLVTVLSFAVFLGIIAWTFSRRNRAGFDDAASLPFREELTEKSAAGGLHE
ncbi:MAG: cbb3-type cytochrome c oxidase subunit 3 [Burkholderiales bacterium]